METQKEHSDLNKSTQTNKVLLIVVGAVVVLALVGAAAVVGFRLTRSDSQEGGGIIIRRSGGGGLDEVSVSIGPGAFIPAPELPDAQPDTSGLISKIEDNSIFVTTGEIRIAIEQDNDGVAVVNANANGPTVEVVVTQNTLIYEEDRSELRNMIAEGQNSEGPLQQVVSLVDSLDDINTNGTVTVWGERTGERVIADVVVYVPLPGVN